MNIESLEPKCGQLTKNMQMAEKKLTKQKAFTVGMLLAERMQLIRIFLTPTCTFSNNSRKYALNLGVKFEVPETTFLG